MLICKLIHLSITKYVNICKIKIWFILIRNTQNNFITNRIQIIDLSKKNINLHNNKLHIEVKQC